MNVRELITIATEQAFCVLSLGEDGAVTCEPLFPGVVTPSPLLVGLLKEHKPELVRLLSWQARADELLLASTRRLAQLWPAGTTTFEDDSAWKTLETLVHEAYWSEDVIRLKAALNAREQYASACWEVRLDFVAERTATDAVGSVPAAAHVEPLLRGEDQ